MEVTAEEKQNDTELTFKYYVLLPYKEKKTTWHVLSALC